MQVGDEVKIKSSGEMCTVHRFYGGDGNPCITKPDGSKQDDVEHSEFDPIPAVIPVKQLRENTITSLDLSSKGLGVDGALILAALIKDNTSVQHLDISSNNLGLEGGKALAASFAENSSITSVRTLFCETVFGLFLLIPLPLPFVLSSPLGKQLHAESNGLRAAGATAFGEVLKTNKTLAVLDLSDNEIGGWHFHKGTSYAEFTSTPEGPTALADGLKANTGVQQLDISANDLGVDGGKAVAASIAENSTITSVSHQQYSFVCLLFLTCLFLALPFVLSLPLSG
jgi:Ran GTPase-activating protein (RanGAP) involved in mRNA processing and transport